MLEALVAKDVRRALGMFSDIIVSPHISTNQITGAAIAGSSYRIPERHLIRALMTEAGTSISWTGVSTSTTSSARTIATPGRVTSSSWTSSNISIRNRKERIEFNQEGYVTIGKLVNEMSRPGI